MNNTIFLLGFMGAGKTTVGRLLADNLHRKFIDLDAHIEKITGKTIANFFAENSEEYFRALETELLKNIVRKRTNNDFVVALGGGTPCSPQNLKIIKARGTSFYLRWSNEDLLTRLKIDGIEKRPLLRGKTDDELRLFIQNAIKAREQFYCQADFIITEKDDEAIMRKIVDIVI